MQRKDLCAYLDTLLEVARFRDYCPNGLQVEGRGEVCKIVTGVTASQALLDAAIEMGADTLLVHHGYFWRGEDGRVTGLRRQRLATLLNNDINLIAYHLPMDAHPLLGNNGQWAQAMGWQVEGRFGDQQIGFWGVPDREQQAIEVLQALNSTLGRDGMLLGDGERTVGRLAWCSGGAQSYFEQAIDLGVDLFVTGEVSEQTTHLARESGIPFIAAGHHATERFGPRALAQHLSNELGLEAHFIDIPNPV